MKIQIHTVADLGLLLRATRRSHRLRLDDVAASARLGPVFVGDVEHGKDTVQMGRVLQLLDELGIYLVADAPEAALAEYERLKAQGIKMRKPRKPRKPRQPRQPKAEPGGPGGPGGAGEGGQ